MNPATEVFELTKNQQECYDAIINSNENFLIVGKPGVGKSVLIRALDNNETGKFYHLSAPTGIAAINISPNAKTIHSLFGIPTSEGIIKPDYDVFPRNERVIDHIRYNIKHVIIDEISMVRADTFDYIDRVLKHVKGNSLPFGGVQIIAVGDFYQLPPVTKASDKKDLKAAGYRSEFMFDSPAYIGGNFKTLQLTQVLRQKGDPAFMDLLSSARDGSLKPAQLKGLNGQIGRPNDIRIELACINRIADAINASRLNTLPTPRSLFYGAKTGDWPVLPVPELVEIKVGAQVMVKVNRADLNPALGIKGKFGFKSRLMNGTLGVVESIHQDPDHPDDEDFCPHVKIKLDDGTTAPVYVKAWERKIKVLQDGKYREQVVATYEQLPLALAWAISSHKSQGQTFSKVHINFKNVFADGQAYVMLSRCKTMSGISLEVGASTSHFTTDKNVIRFMDSIE